MDAVSKKLEAVYENGVLRPLEPLDFPEHQRVTIIVYPSLEEDWLDAEVLEAYPSLAREDIRVALAFAAEMARERYAPIQLRGGSELHYGKEW